MLGKAVLSSGWIFETSQKGCRDDIPTDSNMANCAFGVGGCGTC